MCWFLVATCEHYVVFVWAQVPVMVSKYYDGVQAKLLMSDGDVLNADRYEARHKAINIYTFI